MFHMLVCLCFPGNTEFRAHKIILAYSSDFFARLFSGTWKESTLDRIELKQPDPAGSFDLLSTTQSR